MKFTDDDWIEIATTFLETEGIQDEVTGVDPELVKALAKYSENLYKLGKDSKNEK